MLKGKPARSGCRPSVVPSALPSSWRLALFLYCHPQPESQQMLGESSSPSSLPSSLLNWRTQLGTSHMVFRQALLETRAIQAEDATKLFGKFSLILCWKAFPQSFSEGYTIYNLAASTFFNQYLTFVSAS